MDKTETPPAIPWVDWAAEHIADPVTRLRFLKAAAPMWQPKPAGQRIRPIFTAGLCILALMALVGGSVFAVARSLRPAKSVVAETPRDVARPRDIARGAEAAPVVLAAQDIWQVEKTAEFETYSNGLRIENKFVTRNHARSYLAFPVAGRNGVPGEHRTAPAGIVFHTTESLQEPFEERKNSRLKKVGESLLEYVRQKKAYNFVIDRFGRVFRVVEEGDAAEHAGYSVWSDGGWMYENLNESFIGVALETRTEPGQSQAAVTPGQIRATAVLVEMLRGKYKIAAGNCVTHGQVSVNPRNMEAGYHMDWASSFPFAEVGLPDNYARPLPSVESFGFEYGGEYLRAAGARMYDAAVLGSRELAARAAAAGMSAGAYRKALQRRYRERLAAARGVVVSHEGD